MIFVYVSDLHGDRRAFEEVLRVASDRGAAAVVNGGDLLPKGAGGEMAGQRGFLGWLRGHFGEARSAGLRSLAMFGNDDVASLLPAFDAMVSEGLVERLDAGWIDVDGWSFLGFPYVPDPPFRLKDWCRLDGPGSRCGFQFGTPLVSTPGGLVEAAPSAEAHLERLPTIDDELRLLPRSPDPSRAVFVMHSPPVGADLDACMDGRRVGSAAGRRYIEACAFPLTLHGHIHESPVVTGRWFASVGRTVAVNPGSIDRPEWVLVDTGARTLEHATRGIARF